MCRAIRPTTPTREYRWPEPAPPRARPELARPELEAHPACSSTIAGPGVDPGNDGHPGAQPVEEAVRVVDYDFNGNTLNHFGEIPSRIVGRQERELRAGARRKCKH